MESNVSPQIFSTQNAHQQSRKVGFELEFWGLSIERIAEYITQTFGGEIEKKHKNLSEVHHTELGSFKIELDARPLKKLAEESQKKKKKKEFDWAGPLENIFSSTLSGIIPIEIVSPPIPIDDIPKLDAIIKFLRTEGASDTQQSVLTAFGLHINPETPSFEPDIVLAFIQSFVLLSDWLKTTMPLDSSRKYSGFIADYPREYCLNIMNIDYQPTLEGLIEDYLAFNNSRNRALDMLPLFKFLKEEYISQQCADIRINARPTFHYRLANSQFTQADWNFSKEWQRWLVVESLAKDNRLRLQLAEKYRLTKPKNWLQLVEQYIKL